MANPAHFSPDRLRARMTAVGMTTNIFIKRCQALAPLNMSPCRTGVLRVLDGTTKDPRASSLGLWAEVLNCNVNDFFKKG